jgi:hypothetical protein
MDPKKKKAKATPVSRDELRATFVTLDQTSCDTPLRDNMKALATQNFATASILHHQEFGIATTPSTQLLHYAVTMIRDAGTDSVVDRKTTILDVARQYLKKDSPTGSTEVARGKILFPQETGHTPSESSFMRIGNLTSHPSSINSIFGGSQPIFATKRQINTNWAFIEPEEHGSYAKAMCKIEAFGANVKVSNTQESENGFKVYSYRCRHSDKCEFRSRIFFPSEAIEYDEPVASQIGHEHNCGLVKSWQEHLQGTKKERGNIGVHPLLKSCIDEIKRTTVDPYCLPLPDEMVNRIIDKLGDECTQLFPNGCKDIVTNQIREHWRRQRTNILSSVDDDDKILKYLPELSFSENAIS